MNESSERLIRELSEKLGTTAEHLWGVLVKQAPIDAAVSLFQYGIIALAVVYGFKFCKKLQSKYGRGCDFPVEVVWVAYALVSAIILAAAFFSIPETISGFFNPEYWALNKILRAK